nr:G2/mitotic-specific cyclin-B3-like [Nerophis lumbriciformis]
MPFTRGKRAQARVNAKNKAKENTNEQGGAGVKRTASPSQEAPKKRVAFLNLTNAGKSRVRLPGRKDSSKKKAKAAPATSETGAENKVPNVDKDENEEGIVLAPAEVLKAPLAHLERPQIPAEFDVDAENRDDCMMCPEYAKDIFDYLKSREEKFTLHDFMALQPTINAEMRAILVDWLVEVQENFQLYHETLYLAVKLTDHFLARTSIARDTLQLLGSAAMLIACKFEERNPPCLDDFLYICDDTYNKEEFLSMESCIFKTLGYDIGIPVAYSFLRRYSKCASVGMDTLTLARYYCELSLMDVELAQERASLLAAACLFLALLTSDLGGWSPILEFHSGYTQLEVGPVVLRVRSMVARPPKSNLMAIREKYAHPVFFQVAQLPLMDVDVLEKMLST